MVDFTEGREGKKNKGQQPISIRFLDLELAFEDECVGAVVGQVCFAVYYRWMVTFMSGEIYGVTLIVPWCCLLLETVVAIGPPTKSPIPLFSFPIGNDHSLFSPHATIMYSLW